MRTSPRFPEKKLQKRDYCYMNKNERRRNNKCYRQKIKQMLKIYNNFLPEELRTN